LELFIKGAIAGLTLSCLIGPVFFAIIQTGVEKGFRGGLALCSGIWLSDFIIIMLAYLGLSYILILVSWDGFTPWVGTLGGCILITFGLGALLNPPVNQAADQPLITSRKKYMGLSLKGFVINTLNPFTMVFWLGIMSTVVAESANSGAKATLFFGSLLGVMITFDVLKILLSKKIKTWLNPSNILRLRKGIGFLLIVFGFVLLFRVWW
jgi:threonine/homoserine/homoserine lactone efflux protein